MIQVFHNTRCTKSRECVAFLDEIDAPYEIVKYLETPPTITELKDIIHKINIRPIELVRQKEPLWIEKFKDKKLSNAQIIRVMAKNPILIERPIVINGDKAVIARPPDSIQSII